MLVAVGMLAGHASSAAPPIFEEWTEFQFDTQQWPTRFELVDLNGDGWLDVVCPGRNNGGRAFILRGAGDGSFSNPIMLSVGGQTDWVEAVDVDGDGLRDLVFAARSSGGRVAILRGRGGFAFEEAVFVPVGRDPRAVAVGNEGSDDRRAIFSLQNGESAIRPVSMDDEGAWTAGPRRALSAWVGGLPLPQWMESLDADGDGHRDFGCSVNGAGVVAVVRGAVDNQFGTTMEWRAPTVQGVHPGLLLGAVADVDGNGAPDLLVAGLPLGAPQSVLIFLNDGTGDFSQRVVVPVTNDGLAWSVAAADLDLDGDIDIVFTTALPGRVHILENRMVGGVLQFVGTIAPSTGDFLRHVRIGDLDGDCRPDLVLADYTSHRLLTLRNVTAGIDCGGVAAQAPPAPTQDASASAAAPRRGADAAMVTALRAAVDRAEPDGAAIAEALAAFPSIDDLRAAAAAPPARRSIGAPNAAPRSEGGIAQEFPACGPPAGPCNEPHGGLGCYTPACCVAVCTFDPVCCEVAWDAACVFIAQIECVGLVCPSAGSCFEPHPTRGCDDEACCGRIGRLDPYCRTTAWDELCVIQAERFCAIEACALSSPAPDSVTEDEPCYLRLNQGCSPAVGGVASWIELTCATKLHGTISTSAPRDLDWLRFVLDEPRRVTLRVAAEFPLRLLLLEGDCDGTIRTVVDAASFDCHELVIDRCLEPGTYHAVLTNGIAERLISSGQPCDEIDPKAPPPDPEDPPFVPGDFGLHWQASFDCPNGLIAGDFNGDGRVDGNDLGTLLGFWGVGSDGDLNCDGRVDGSDLGTLLGNWTG